MSALIAESNRDHDKRSRPFSPAEFFPELEAPTSSEERTANMKAKMRALATMFRKR